MYLSCYPTPPLGYMDPVLRWQSRQLLQAGGGRLQYLFTGFTKCSGFDFKPQVRVLHKVIGQYMVEPKLHHTTTYNDPFHWQWLAMLVRNVVTMTAKIRPSSYLGEDL